MKLILKLTLLLVVVSTVVLAAHAYVSTEREIALFESDMRNDVRQLGHAPLTAASYVLRTQGEERALEVFHLDVPADANPRIRLRWVRPGASPGDPLRPDVGELGELSRGELERVAKDPTGDERYYMYFPVRTDPSAAPRLALEISESLAYERAFVQATVRSELVTVAVLAGAISGIAALLGIWLVGAPARRLAEQARRVGAGDLSARLPIDTRDELSDVAQEMNHMCDRLVAAQARLAQETEARIAALDQLRHADRLATVGRLAAGVAHELGTPLNVVVGRAEAVATGEVQGDEAKRNAGLVVEQAERIAAIIRQLLDFARPSRVERARCDLASLVRKTLDLLARIAEKSNVALSFDTPATAAVVEADSGQIGQALTNLVVNGIQAMPRGGRLVVAIDRVRARAPADLGEAEGEFVRLSVRDEGIGIAKENLGRVFEPFFTTKDVGEGTGLGLPVSYGIVREHGGWIGVESEVGKGSTFSIYLPPRNTS